MTNSFKGSSLEFRPIGLKYCYITEFDELYHIKRPDNSANNIIFGQLYVDMHGEMCIKNTKTKEYCKINVSRQGWTNRHPCKLEGKVYDA